jgi:O-antigen ligase
MACLAIALPTLLAFNLPPSATFLNQAVAVIGWGALLSVFAECLRAGRLPFNPGLAALFAALALLGAAALAAPLWAALPWALSLSALGLVLAAMLVAVTGAALSRAGLRTAAFRALCVALVVAGVSSMLIGIVQVFVPDWADGNWIAASSLAGRAVGNLRQPNHLSSLLLWSAIAALWLAETGSLRRDVMAALVALFVFGMVLSASRTGTVGVVMLALWGALDRRLSRSSRAVLLLTPVAYVVSWIGLTAWAHATQQVFGGEARITHDADISSSRFGIWSNAWALVAQHPWAGVGFGEFNFAWSLTPFPQRPTAFFDHTHNLPLQLAVELGLPLTLLVLALLAFALWRAFVAGRDAPGPQGTVLRAAFMMVLMMAVHSQFEYPLWYAYFLLPTAFAFGLCLGVEPTRDEAAANVSRTRPLLLASLVLLAGGAAALYDYVKVVVIFSPPTGAAPLAQRIADGERSWFFSHHAGYAEATTADHPSQAMTAFALASHYLLDTRLMMAWAHAYAERGDLERARHLAQRLREFRNDDSEEFFAPCDVTPAEGAALPFQCTPPTKALDYRDFK